MKKTIKIECPDGYKPIYNTETNNLEFVPETIIDKVKTYEDACDVLGIAPIPLKWNQTLNAMYKLQIILNALNNDHKFDLLTGKIWYPWVQFFRVKSMPKNAKIIGQFRYQDENFALVGGLAVSGGNAGLSYFYSDYGVSDASSLVGIFACKSKKIAEYVSTQFGKLIFTACFTIHFDEQEFEWIN